MTGTFRSPRFAIAYSAGKIILWARSPVTPKSTSASECEAVMQSPPSAAAAFSTWPPNAWRIAESTLSAKSASPRELKRS